MKRGLWGAGQFSHSRARAASNLLKGLNQYVSNTPSTFPPATITDSPKLTLVMFPPALQADGSPRAMTAGHICFSLWQGELCQQA